MMLTAIWESAAMVLGSTIVANYLFPLVSGIWLAFVTANLITLRSLEARATSAFRQLRWDLVRMTPNSGTELMNMLIDLGLPVLDAADELESRGFLRTANAYREAILRLQNPITQEVQIALIASGIPAGLVDRERINSFFAPYRNQSIVLIEAQKDTSIAMVRHCRIEWFTVFELTTVNQWIDKHGGGRVSDCPRRPTV